MSVTDRNNDVIPENLSLTNNNQNLSWAKKLRAFTLCKLSEQQTFLYLSCFENDLQSAATINSSHSGVEVMFILI